MIECVNQEIIKKYIPNYRERSEQVRLIEKISEAINSGKKVIFAEAGTGTGKSFATLFPALFYALNTQNVKSNIIYSTHSIILQHQIKDKDYKIALKIQENILEDIGKPVNYNMKCSIILGKSNYICHKKIFKDVNDPKILQTINAKEQKDFLRIKKMAPKILETKNCTIEDVNLGIVPLISKYTCYANASNCKDCKIDLCMFSKPNKPASSLQRNDINIINHSLLFAALKISISKPFKSKEDRLNDISQLLKGAIVIIDEAHKIEDTIDNLFSVEMTYRTILRKLENLLVENYGDFHEFVILNYLSSSLYNKYTKQLSGFVSDEKYLSAEFFNYNVKYIKNEVLSSNKNIQNILNDLYEFCSELKVQFNSILVELKKQNISINPYYESFSNVKELVDLLEVITFKKYNKYTDIVYITSNEHNQLVLGKNTLSVDPDFYTALFSSARAVIFMSATLTINHTFNYFKNVLGFNNPINHPLLSQEDIICLSPFDLEKNMKILGKNNSSNDFDELIYTINKISSGSLLLFTSNKTMKFYYEALKDKLDSSSKEILIQGINTKREILQKSKLKNCIIFAVASFWEGIDLQGERLEFLYINKLPFDNPGDIILDAKSDMLKQRGRNAFMDMFIPRAIQKFKQGIGRLIRTETDHGLVLIHDSRIFDPSKKYGKFFLDEAPVKIEQYTDINDFIIKTKDIFNEND